MQKGYTLLFVVFLAVVPLFHGVHYGHHKYINTQSINRSRISRKLTLENERLLLRNDRGKTAKEDATFEEGKKGNLEYENTKVPRIITQDVQENRNSFARLTPHGRRILTAESKQQRNAENMETKTALSEGRSNVNTVRDRDLSKSDFLIRKLLSKNPKKILMKREADPEPVPTSEPKPEPKTTSIAEPGKGSPESNPNATSGPEPGFRLWPEPEPEWSLAKLEWQEAWPAHVYGFTVVFAILGIISLFELTRLHVGSRRKTALKVSLLIMIFTFCLTRAVVLTANPYNSTNDVNHTFIRLVFSLGHPCIISAMSLLLLVLIDTTKMNVAPPTFQRVQAIIIVVSIHIVLVFVTDIIVAYFFKGKVLILVCQLYYITIGTSLSTGYARVGWKISKNSAANINRDSKMKKLKFLIVAAAATGTLTIAVTIYGAAGVFGIYSDVTTVAAWPWWGFQTVLRMLEVAMVVVLLLMNINVAGSRTSLRMFANTFRKRIFKENKVAPASLAIQSVISHSWAP